MATHSSTLAWKIPWMEEPGRLQSMGSLRVGLNWLHFHALKKEMATHSSILAWRIPGMGEPGGLPSMGSHRVGHDWSDLAAAAGCLAASLDSTHWMSKVPPSWEVKVLVPQLCTTLQDPHGLYSPPGSSVHRILQARILKWLAIPFTRRSSQHKDWTQGACIAGRFFISWATGSPPPSMTTKNCLKNIPWGQKKKKKHWILLMFKSQQFLKWGWWSQIT